MTPQQAAGAIVDLINASPRSPRPAEIEAIVVRVASRPVTGPSKLATRIRAVMEPLRTAITAANNMRHDDPRYPELHAHDTGLCGEFHALCKELWATPVTTFDDLLVRAEIAQFEARDWPAPHEPWPMLHEHSMDECNSNEAFRQLGAAVLATTGGALSLAPLVLPDHVLAYRDRVREYVRQCKVHGEMLSTDPTYAEEDRRSTELSRRLDAAGEVILDTPATTWGDLVGLASMVAHEQGHDFDALGDDRYATDDDCDPGPIAAELLALAILRRLPKQLVRSI